MAVSCALPVLARPCIENVRPEALPCKSAKVMDWLNGPEGVLASRRLAELLVNVSVLLVGGAAPKLID